MDDLYAQFVSYATRLNAELAPATASMSPGVAARFRLPIPDRDAFIQQWQEIEDNPSWASRCRRRLDVGGFDAEAETVRSQLQDVIERMTISVGRRKAA